MEYDELTKLNKNNKVTVAMFSFFLQLYFEIIITTKMTMSSLYIHWSHLNILTYG